MKEMPLPRRRSRALLALLLKLLAVIDVLLIGRPSTKSTTSTCFTTAETIPPFMNGVPGSGYGCDRKCSGGMDDDGRDDRDDDVHYVIRASLQTYPLHLPTLRRSSATTVGATDNSASNTERVGGAGVGAGMNVSMFTRTFEGVTEER